MNLLFHFARRADLHEAWRRMVSLASVGLVLGMISLGGGAGCSRSSVDPEVVAEVGGEKIRQQDLLAEAERRQRIGRAVPDRETLLREMIEHRAMLQQARASGVDKDPAVQRELEMLLLTRWWEREATPQLGDIQVSDAEVAAEYERQRGRYTQPGQVRLAMLRLDVPANATEVRRAETRARLMEARQRVRDNPAEGGRGPAATGFGVVAVDYSDDQASRYRGGDLGWLEPGNFSYHWPRPFLEAAFALKRGEVSGIIETDSAFYVAMHVDSRPAAVIPLERVQANLKQSLLVQKRQALERELKAQTFGNRPVKVHDSALAEVELPVTRPAPLAGVAPPAAPGTPPTPNDRGPAAP